MKKITRDFLDQMSQTSILTNDGTYDDFYFEGCTPLFLSEVNNSKYYSLVLTSNLNGFESYCRDDISSLLKEGNYSNIIIHLNPLHKISNQIFCQSQLICDEETVKKLKQESNAILVRTVPKLDKKFYCIKASSVDCMDVSKSLIKKVGVSHKSANYLDLEIVVPYIVSEKVDVDIFRVGYTNKMSTVKDPIINNRVTEHVSSISRVLENSVEFEDSSTSIYIHEDLYMKLKSSVKNEIRATNLTVLSNVSSDFEKKDLDAKKLVNFSNTQHSFSCVDFNVREINESRIENKTHFLNKENVSRFYLLFNRLFNLSILLLIILYAPYKQGLSFVVFIVVVLFEIFVWKSDGFVAPYFIFDRKLFTNSSISLNESKFLYKFKWHELKMNELRFSVFNNSYIAFYINNQHNTHKFIPTLLLDGKIDTHGIFHNLSNELTEICAYLTNEVNDYDN